MSASAAMAGAAHAARHQHLIKCRVSVKYDGGEQTYDGLFPTTCDAALDAAERAGDRPCKVTVKALQ